MRLNQFPLSNGVLVVRSEDCASFHFWGKLNTPKFAVVFTVLLLSHRLFRCHYCAQDCTEVVDYCWDRSKPTSMYIVGSHTWPRFIIRCILKVHCTCVVYSHNQIKRSHITKYIYSNNISI